MVAEVPETEILCSRGGLGMKAMVEARAHWYGLRY